MMLGVSPFQASEKLPPVFLPQWNLWDYQTNSQRLILLMLLSQSGIIQLIDEFYNLSPVGKKN